jgi:hypothetical protein
MKKQEEKKEEKSWIIIMGLSTTHLEGGVRSAWRKP